MKELHISEIEKLRKRWLDKTNIWKENCRTQKIITIKEKDQIYGTHEQINNERNRNE